MLESKILSKKVLIVCDDFPPRPEVGGVRPAMMAKYLPEFGWQVSVLTRGMPVAEWSHPSRSEIRGLPNVKDVHLVEHDRQAEQTFIARRGLISTLDNFFRPEKAHPPGLAHAMSRRLDDLVAVERPDIIWATCPTMAPLGVANHAWQKHKIPWIADFRDTAQQELGSDVTVRHWVLRQRMIWRQRSLTKSAAAACTVSNHHASELAEDFGRPVEVIYNGFDPDMFVSTAPGPTSVFQLVYMGRILNTWLHEPRLLFDSLDALLETGQISTNEISVDFYGAEPETLATMLAPRKCRNVVRALPRVDYAEVPNILSKANACLLLTNRGRDGILTTKAFEYMGIGRPVLCIPGDGGELDKLLHNTHAGVSCDSVEAICKAIMGWFKEWRTGGVVACCSNHAGVAEYSRRRQAQRLSAMLEIAASLQ